MFFIDDAQGICGTTSPYAKVRLLRHFVADTRSVGNAKIVHTDVGTEYRV